MKEIEISGANRFETFTKTRAGSRAVILRDGMILLSHETVTGWWLVPGGGMEEGETSEMCCVREVEEETGYIANRWISLGYINTTPGFCDEKLYLYKAEELTYVGAHPDDGEIIKSMEITIPEVMLKIKSGEINDAKTLCAILRGLH